MVRRPLILVSGALLVALTVLVWMGQRLLDRDRADLVARYGHARELGIEEAVRGFAGEVADIGDDLELASTLLQSAPTSELAERELHAIATIKREYLVMYARSDAGETTKVTAYDAPPGVGPRSDATLEQLLRVAEQHPGRLHVSDGFVAPGDPASWYRVFARRAKQRGPAVAVVVDVAVLLTRMKLQRDPMTRTAIFDGNGSAAAKSDEALARLVIDRPATFRPLVTSVRGGAKSTTIIDGAVAQRIGLPATAAVVLAIPLAVDSGPPWTLLVAASTQTLQTQERVIVQRVLVGGVLVLALLLSAAAYVLHNAFRARTLRDRLKHADRLAHLTEKAEKILDHIPSGVLALSEDRRVTGVNRWLAERMGTNLMGRQLAAAFDHGHAEDISRVAEMVDRTLRAREPESLHFERSTLLGTEAALNIHAVPLARGVGDVSVLLVFEDLTELRRIEQRLLHSEKLVTAGQLAAGIAHEIGTPLNVARGRVELALSHLGDKHAEAENHRLVIDQIDRVTRLIQQLLDYVRSAPNAVQEVDLMGALHAVRDLLAPQAAKRNVTLEVAGEGEPFCMQTDPDQIQQIVVNLALNAIDACDGGGVVTLRMMRRDATLVLEIADTGHGIPRDIQKHVFDPFFTTKKRGQGTGLGLWVVAQLVRAQSGEIELDSTPGEGTTVRVRWPVRS